MSYFSNFILIDGKIVDIEEIKDNLVKIIIYSVNFNPIKEEKVEETHDVYCEDGVAEYIKKFVEEGETLAIKGHIDYIDDEEIIKAEKIFKNTLNIVKLHGFVGKKEIKKNNVTILNIATNDFRKDQSTGEIEKATDWHRIVCFNKVSDVVKESIQEGDLISVLGKLKTNIFEDKKFVEVHAEKVRLKRKSKQNKGEDND